MQLLLDIPTAAHAIGVAARTLENWAYARSPAPHRFPPPVRVGRLLRFRAADLEHWVNGLVPAPQNEPPRDERQPALGNLPPLTAPVRRRGRPRKTQAAE